MDNKKSQTIGAMSLSDCDKQRLERLAPIFDIQFARIGASDYELRKTEDVEPARLDVQIAHARLLLELCSRCAPWLYFHFGESCKYTLLGRSDSDLFRVAELYARKRDESANEESAASDLEGTEFTAWL
jgi:hypothetical protein